MHGVQLWAGMDPTLEDCDPSFEHYGAEEIPDFEGGPVRIRLIAGTGFGHRSPVGVTGPTGCADLQWRGDGNLAIDTEHEEHAVYPLEGAADVNQSPVGRGQLAVVGEAGEMKISATAGTRLLLIGGARRRAPLHMHWNYASSSPTRRLEARRRWADGAFPSAVGDDDTPESDPTPAP